MLRTFKSHLSYANVMASIGVFAALGGGVAVAAGLDKDSVKSKHVKDNTLKSQDIKDGSGVTGADVSDDSLKGADVDESSLNIPQQSLPSSLPPSGAAGGSLAGTYPNPSLAPNSVGANEVTDGSVGSGELGEGSVGASEVQNGSLRAADVGTVTGSFTLDPASIAAGDCNLETPSVPGAQIGDIPIVRIPFNHMDTNDEYSITVGQGAIVGGLRIKYCNVSGGAQDPPSETFEFVLIRP